MVSNSVFLFLFFSPARGVEGLPKGLSKLRPSRLDELTTEQVQREVGRICRISLTVKLMRGEHRPRSMQRPVYHSNVGVVFNRSVVLLKTS